MMRSQLSWELEEGRAARLLGLSAADNPHRKAIRTMPENRLPYRIYEIASNWDAGWVQENGRLARAMDSTRSTTAILMFLAR